MIPYRVIAMHSTTTLWFLAALAVAPALHAAPQPMGATRMSAASYVAEELLVKFRPQSDASVQEGFISELGARGRQRLSGSRLQRITLPSGADPQSVAALYAADPRIEYVQPNYRYYTQATIPNDSDYSKLWGLKNSGQTISEAVYSSNNPGSAGADMNAEAAWDLQSDCRGTVVAVIDTGINYTHTDLAANMWDGGVSYPHHGFDFVDNDNDPIPSDGESHGTHVAGTIAAVGNNANGTTGVCWQASIMSVRVLGAGGMGNTAEIVQGIDFAVTQGARVINMSLGGGQSDPAFEESIADADAAGVIVVVAAGNGGADGVGDNNDFTPLYPCSFRHNNIICVAALDQGYALASFSNYGSSSVDVGAPGVNVQSTVAGTFSSENFSGWTRDASWSVATGTYCPQLSLTTPADYCSNETSEYAINSSASAYYSYNLQGLLGAGVAMQREYFIDSSDSLLFGVKPTGGDPFSGGTIVASNNGIANPAVFFAYDLSRSGCLTTSCSVGFQLLSDSSITSLGSRIFDFALNTTIENATTYDLYNGTSMATPHVAGLAALVWSFNPEYTHQDVIRSVTNSGDALAALADKSTSGRAVDAYKTLLYIQAPTGVSAVIQQ